MAKYLLGFDVGGTKCAVVLGRENEADQPPEIVAKEVFPTKLFPTPCQVIDKLLEVALLLVDRTGTTLEQVVAGGVSCGGPLNSATGIILSPPNLPGWDRVPIGEMLERALQLPIRVQNDANACAFAEWKWGAARHTATAVFLTFGTGMGAGLIIDGRLHTGKDDLAGEVGHWRMADDGPVGYEKKGSFEGFCSGGGMARLARQKVREAWALGETVAFCRDESDLTELDVPRLSQAARAGAPLALAIFETTARELGQGLALLIDLLNPEVIVIGSIFARCEDLLRAQMNQVLTLQVLPAALRRCRVLPAALGEHIGDFASLAVAQSVTENDSAVSPRP